MIRVTIEKLPFGDETKKECLYVIYLINDGTGNSEIGHYDVELFEDRKCIARARVGDHIRAGHYALLRLVTRAMEAVRLALP